MRNCVQVFLLDWRTDKANDNFKKINRMKKFITLMILSALCLGAKAQQINGDFDDTWVDCVPWDSNGNTNSKGKQPNGWKISNVYTTLSAVEVGASVSDASGGKAVKLTNKEVVGQKIPGYLTLGTPWATAETKSTSVRNADGGTFGSISFTFKPDALSFDYQRDNSNGTSEIATVVAYLWSGTWIQKDVPGNTAVSLFPFKWGTATTIDMTDRDRNVLGMQTSLGGNITSTGKKIASLQYSISQSTSQWENITIDFTYDDFKSSVEKANVIFSANDYFGDRSSIVSGNSLTIDNVKFIYYHSLDKCTYNGDQVEFDKNNSASVSALYDKSKLAYEKKGVGAIVEEAYNDVTGVLTITVKGNDYDADNNSVTTYTKYTIQFATASATLAVNSAAQYGTFCAPFDVTIPQGVTAYIISGIAENGKLTLVEQQNTIPAHTPVIVYSESASGINEVQFGVATTATATSKYLTGVYTDTKAPVGSYVLQNQRGRVGFYQVQEGIQPMVRANRAYLTVPASANVKAFYMDDATAIQTVEELLSGKAEIYDLAGRRQQKLQKGINIVGGKKVLVK